MNYNYCLTKHELQLLSDKTWTTTFVWQNMNYNYCLTKHELQLLSDKTWTTTIVWQNKNSADLYSSIHLQDVTCTTCQWKTIGPSLFVKEQYRCAVIVIRWQLYRSQTCPCLSHENYGGLYWVWNDTCLYMMYLITTLVLWKPIEVYPNLNITSYQL